MNALSASKRLAASGKEIHHIAPALAAEPIRLTFDSPTDMLALTRNLTAVPYNWRHVMLEYKVVEKKTKSFLKGRMSSADFQILINTYAEDGWILDRVVAGDTAYVMGLGSKDVFLLIFRRERHG